MAEMAVPPDDYEELTVRNIVAFTKWMVEALGRRD